MKHFMLDYLRRWKSVYILGLVGLSALWLVALGSGERLRAIPFAVYFGALLCSFELMRGSGKIAATLPLSKREVGTAWWLMNTVVPVAITTLSKLIGIGLGLIFAPDRAVPPLWVPASAAVDFAYAGAFHFVLTCAPAIRTSLGGGLYGLAWGGGLSGWVFAGNTGLFNEFTPMGGMLLATGFALTIAGWYRSPGLVGFGGIKPADFGRTSRRTGTFSAARTETQTGTGSDNRRFESVPNLLWVSFTGSLAFACVFAGLMVFFNSLIRRLSLHEAVQGLVAFNPLPFYWVFSSYMLLGFNLRWAVAIRSLRVLPLTATQLNLMLMAATAVSSFAFWLAPVVLHLVVAQALPARAGWDVLAGLISVTCLVSALTLRWNSRRVILGLLVVAPMAVLASAVMVRFIPEFAVGGLVGGLVFMAVLALAGWINQFTLKRHSDTYKTRDLTFGMMMQTGR